MVSVNPAHVEIKVARTGDLEPVREFFERTMYEPEAMGERTLVLRAPGAVDDRLARREVLLYLGLLRRLRPGLAASLVD
jgi:hypothetical protein